MWRKLNFKVTFREDHLKVRREDDKKEKKRNWSLLRLIIRIAGFILKLLRYLQYLRYYFVTKTIPALCVSITVVVVVVIITDELTSEGPKDIQEGAGSGTQPTEDRHISEQLKDIREHVKSGTQRMEDMRKSVKAMDEDVQKMSKQVKKMKEKVDGQSEN